MAETLKLDSGGTYTSLGGKTGQRGLNVHSITGALAAGATSQFGPSDLRMWMVVQNTGANDILVGFGDDASAGVTVRPGGDLQIDDNLPWCGTVAVLSVLGSSVCVVEARVNEG